MIGRVVISKAGRDKGRLMVVVNTLDEVLLVCDGRKRRLQSPKVKNSKHLELTDYRLNSKDYSSNRSLKKALYELKKDIVTAKEEI